MRIANLNALHPETWTSPSGKFNSSGASLTEAVGAESRSTDLLKRWPFDVEIAGLPPGAASWPYHSHSNQYEFYIVLSGVISVRHREGTSQVRAGDFFMFQPGEAHQFLNETAEDATYYCIADNPLNEHCYYPDSDKYAVGLHDSREVIQVGRRVPYFHGEDSPDPAPASPS